MSTKKRLKQPKIFDSAISVENANSRKRYKRYTLYIPENIDIDDLLASKPPPFRYMSTRYRNFRDNLVYIMHLINSIPFNTNDFDFESSRGFTPINKEVLKKRVHKYRSCIEYLKGCKIIIEGTSYSVGKRSKGLKFYPEFVTKVKAVEITSSSLIKSIVSRHHFRDIEAEKKLSFLKDWFNANLTIDYELSLYFLEDDKRTSRIKVERRRSERRYSANQRQTLLPIDEVVLMGYISKCMAVEIIHNSDFVGRVKIDSNVGRLHSPLTRIKKGLRKYLKYGGNQLCSVDIVNSQPLIALIVLDIEIFERMNIKGLITKYNETYQDITYHDINNHLITKDSPSYTMLVNLMKESVNKPDVLEFKKAVVEGTFYEKFGQILLECGEIPAEILSIVNPEVRQKEIRSFAKNATFSALFEKAEAAKWSRYVRAFKTCFPNVYKIFQQVKSGKDKHNTLACIFQKFESRLVLHFVCLDIHNRYPNVPLFTIHDSVVTTVEHENLVRDIFFHHLKAILGVEPQVSLEVWG